MRCQDIERLILEASERGLSREEESAVDQHLAQCAPCAGFRGFWKELRASLQNAAAPSLSSRLEERVRLACREELNLKLQGRKQPERLAPSAPVPWPIWAALAILTLLTLSFLIPGIEEFLQNQKITLEAVLILLLLLQNSVMLFFAPVIMRRRRLSRPDL